jgi:hypothetical protein
VATAAAAAAAGEMAGKVVAGHFTARLAQPHHALLTVTYWQQQQQQQHETIAMLQPYTATPSCNCQAFLLSQSAGR